MTEPREVEAKFEIDDVSPLLDAMSFPPLRIARTLTLHQRDTYLDTADARLKAAASTLRVRASDGTTTLTFKGPREAMSADLAHVAARPEINALISANEARTLLTEGRLATEPDPLVAASPVVGSATLQPVATIENIRTAIDLIDSEGNTFELAIDRCVGIRLRDRREISFGEIELEAKTASYEAFVAAVDALHRAAPELRPSHHTKLGRVLG